MTPVIGSMFVRESGPAHGTPVVLLHSLFFDGSMFDALLAELDSTRFRYVVPDHRGQGGSGDGALDLESLAEDVAGVLAERCDGPAHVVGSSMGGYVGTFLAARHPRLVRTCTLMGGTAEAELDPAYFASLEHAVRVGDPDVADRIEHTMFGDDHLALPIDGPVRSRWREHFTGLSSRVADAAHAVFTRPALHDAFAAVRAPVLLIAGESDHAKPPVQMKRMLVAKPSARLVVLPGVGHTPAVEAPAQVAELLLEHWSRSPLLDDAPTRPKTPMHDMRGTL